MTSGADLLRVEGLRITFSVLGGEVQAVNNANFRILPGKVTALVGESGSGKSAISQAVMGILPNVARVGGKILFNDPTTAAKPIDLLALEREGEEICSLRGTRISKIFQEPMTSLSPLHTIGNQISEVLKIHTDAERRNAGRGPRSCLAMSASPIPSVPTTCIRSSFPAACASVR